MTRAQETADVRRALQAAGYDVAVTHGRGTAYGWLEVTVYAGRYADHERERDGTQAHGCSPACAQCRLRRETLADVYRVAQAVTGRHGEYDGQINAHTEDARTP